MNGTKLQFIIIGLLLILCGIGGYVLKPKHHVTDLETKVNLEEMIPTQFSEWQWNKNIAPVQADPGRVAMLNKIYNQTLSRTYVDKQGNYIMLSIAYGGDQSDAMQVHKPEVCYPAQGFQIGNLEITQLDTGFKSIPVKHMVATQGQRIEPITYWITIGDTVAVSGLKWKIEQIKYALSGKVPDGMIFRVSSIGNANEGYLIQQQFIKDLLRALTESDRKRILGNTTL